MSNLEKILKDLSKKTFQQILRDLNGVVVEIPQETCDCGKTLFFLYGRTTCTCSRCGAKWKLQVSITQTKKGEIE